MLNLKFKTLLSLSLSPDNKPYICSFNITRSAFASGEIKFLSAIKSATIESSSSATGVSSEIGSSAIYITSATFFLHLLLMLLQSA